MLPQGFIQDLLARVDIVEVVGRHVELKKAGINHKGLCPFHGEKSPSFIVSPSRQTYHCFGCGVHGDAIRFLTEQGGLHFMDAVRELAQGVGLAVPEDDRSAADRERATQERERQQSLSELLARAGEHWRGQLKATPRAVDYLKRRGLTGDIAARFGLGYAPDSWRGLASAFPDYAEPKLVEAGLVIVQGDEGPEQKRYDRFRDRIMFPIRSVKGEVIGFGGRVLDTGEPKYLNSPETPVFVKGRELYGLYEARQALRTQGYALVVEGYMDVVALAQHGLPNAVATLGTACTAEHVAKLFRFTDAVVFSFDGDAAGRRAATRALEAALPHASDLRSIRFLFLPPEHDPDSYVREHGTPAFEQAVAQALPLSRMLLQTAGEGADLATPEGRARLLAQAAPLHALLPAGLLREQMLAEIAAAGGMAPEPLARLWAGQPRAAAATPAASTPPRVARASGRRMSVAATSLLDRAAWLLLQQCGLWDSLGPAQHEQLAHQAAPYGGFFSWLERQVHEHGALTMSTLQEQAQLADEALAALAQRLTALHALDPDINIGTELAAVLHRLDLQQVDDELKLITESGELSGNARQRYMALAQRRALLKRGPV